MKLKDTSIRDIGVSLKLYYGGIRNERYRKKM